MTDAYEWAGNVGETWAAEWRTTDRAFTGISEALIGAAVDLLAGVDRPRVLEIGCGAGTTSFTLADAIPSASILGVDISPALVAVANERAVAHPSCRFVVGDASTWDSESDFDLILSRHGVMFFDDPVAAFTTIHARARPGAHLLFSCFRDVGGNPWSWIGSEAPPVPSQAPGPFAFADPDRVTRLLGEAGWRDVRPMPIDTAYIVGEGADAVAQARAMFTRIGPSAAALRRADAEQARAITALIDRRVADAFDGNRVAFPAAAWLWRACA